MASFLGGLSMTNVRFNSDVQGGQPKIQHHLRHLRTQRGLTLKQISDGTGLSISTLHAIEKQQREPTRTSALKLAHFYGLPVADIWQPLFGQICREVPDGTIENDS